MRLRKKNWAEEELLHNPLVISKPKNNINIFLEKINLFKRVEIEIGCGKGQFIKKHAALEADVLFLAVEKYESVLCMATKSFEETDLNNLYFYQGDIIDFLDNQVFFKKIDKIYLNFSDPWPKKKHTKRRLTFPTFLNLYYNLLKDTGKIEQKTDNDKFFEYSLKSFANFKSYEFEDVLLDLHSSENKSRVFKTEYEEKFISMNKPIKYLKLRKR